MNNYAFINDGRPMAVPQPIANPTNCEWMDLNQQWNSIPAGTPYTPPGAATYDSSSPDSAWSPANEAAGNMQCEISPNRPPVVMPTTTTTGFAQSGFYGSQPADVMTSNYVHPSTHNSTSGGYANMTVQTGAQYQCPQQQQQQQQQGPPEKQIPYAAHCYSVRGFSGSQPPAASMQVYDYFRLCRGDTFPEAPQPPTTGHRRLEDIYAEMDPICKRYCKQDRGQIRLWQFLLELLSDINNRDCIVWQQQPGEFKITDPKDLAGRWGKRKEKKDMNYEKLSRAIRYYYEHKIIQKVLHKRYTYRYDFNAVDRALKEKHSPAPVPSPPPSQSAPKLNRRCVARGYCQQDHRPPGGDQYMTSTTFNDHQLTWGDYHQMPSTSYMGNQQQMNVMAGQQDDQQMKRHYHC